MTSSSLLYVSLSLIIFTYLKLIHYSYTREDLFQIVQIHCLTLFILIDLQLHSFDAIRCSFILLLSVLVI
jgi:hypothetical protein